jgi:hypothetical protein
MVYIFPGRMSCGLMRDFQRLCFGHLYFLKYWRGRGNGKVVSLLNLAPRHEGVLGERRYSSTHSLTSALSGGEWSASRPGRFTPEERDLGTHWIGGWVGPRAVLNVVVKRKIPSPRRELNPRNRCRAYRGGHMSEYSLPHFWNK